MDRDYARRLLARLSAGQGHHCCYCRRRFMKEGPRRATLEHCKAKMDGGRDNVANLKAACFHCNQHRGQQMNRARQIKANTRARADAGRLGPLLAP